MAAERLSALARGSEAKESATRVPLAEMVSLTGARQRSGGSEGGSDAGGSAVGAPPPRAGQKFSEADVSGLVMCHRPNGSRWVLGGDHTGQVRLRVSHESEALVLGWPAPSARLQQGVPHPCGVCA